MTEVEFDLLLESARTELNRAHGCMSRGSRSVKHVARLKAAKEVIVELQKHPIMLARKAARKALSIERAKARSARRIRKPLSENQRKIRNEKARLRMAKWQKTDAYREWYIKDRENRVKRKEKYRRAAGAVPREQLSRKSEELAAQRAALNTARRAARADFLINFIGPPQPRKALTDAQYYAWRIKNSPDFYAKELDRAQRYKARTRPKYKDSIIKWAEMPAAMKEVKHLQYLISRQLERATNENDQRAS